MPATMKIRRTLVLFLGYAHYCITYVFVSAVGKIGLISRSLHFHFNFIAITAASSLYYSKSTLMRGFPSKYKDY